MSVLRPMQEDDFKAFWPVFSKILQRRETYALEPCMTLEQGLRDWVEAPHESWVVEQEGKIKAIYYLKANAAGPGAHVCNCGYMVSLSARGQGLARMMCEHSQQRALELGYKAMQFNAVVSTNRVAVTLWEKLGYRKVGVLPRAFKHPEHGYIDSFVMYKWLAD